MPFIEVKLIERFRQRQETAGPYRHILPSNLSE